MSIFFIFESIMVILLLSQIFVFLWYLSFVIKNYGILPSISDSWYKLPQSIKYYFTFFTWGVGIPMMFMGDIWFFISGIGFSFVGAATRFKLKDKFTPIFHFTGAAVGILSALTGIGYYFNDWAPLIMFLVFSVVLIIFNLKKIIWWIEILAFICVVWGLFSNISHA